MLSRHFLRAKVLQSVYAAQADAMELAIVERNFKHNISRLNDLGTIQVAALAHFGQVVAMFVDEAQHKYLPTEAERNPNLRLQNNVFLRRLNDNYDVRRHSEDTKVNWSSVEYDEIFRQAYQGVIKLPEYAAYMNSEETFKNDQDFAIKIFKHLMNLDSFRDYICPQSLLWEDDFDQIAQYNFMMLKTLDESMDEATKVPLMIDLREEKDSEAYEFARHLLLVTMRHRTEVEDMIRAHLKGWEYERVAGMDVLLLNMAVAELTECPSIPERVTVDEYIELSKEYSTDRSKLFINGILDKFIIELRSAGKINKTGRGLLEADDSMSGED